MYQIPINMRICVGEYLALGMKLSKILSLLYLPSTILKSRSRIIFVTPWDKNKNGRTGAELDIPAGSLSLAEPLAIAE